MSRSRASRGGFGVGVGPVRSVASERSIALPMMATLTLLLVVGVTFALFATTPAGGRFVRWMGLGRFLPGAASSEDIAYLHSACGGDRRRARERVAFERARYPDLSEAELHRRAIRRVFAERERESPT